MDNYKKFREAVGNRSPSVAFNISDDNTVVMIDATTGEILEDFGILTRLSSPLVFKRAKIAALLRKKNWNPDRFTTDYKINPNVSRVWDIDPDNLLASETVGGEKIGKFSWHPMSGEFIPTSREDMHSYSIHNLGSHEFDEYVRGIVMPKQQLVATRPWYPDPDMFMKDRRGANYLSTEAQKTCRAMLKRAGLPNGWKFQMNTTNDLLEKTTGIRGW